VGQPAWRLASRFKLAHLEERAGWTSQSLKPGDQVTLTGWRARSGSNSLWITKTVVNGQELKTAQGN